MSDPLVLVTGATGKTGSIVVEQLRDRGVHVRALAHRIDDRSAHLASLGAEVRAVDIFDPYQMAAALKGVSRLYYVPPWHPHMLHSAVILATEAHRAGVDTVVGLTQWLANPLHPSLATKQNWLVDRLFAMMPDSRHIRIEPGFFADNYLGYGLIDLAAQLGIFPTPTLQGRNAPPSNEDIARVATAALLDPDRHAGRSYRPTGPELLTIAEMADIVGNVVGRRVRPMRIPEKMFMRAQKVMGRPFGMDDFQVSNVSRYYQEHRLGTWEVGAPTSHVKDVTGSCAEEFATIAQRYAAGPQSHRTSRNLTRAIWQMIKIGFTGTPRPDRLDAIQQHPAPAATQLSGESPRWLGEHRASTGVGPIR